jgi:citrate synthase
VAEETLTIKDNRTGNEVEIPISDGTIRATDLRQLGLMSYDPAFLNTASTRSGITFIDGDAGILRYRGYPIEQLAEHASFLETAWLLFEGELPTRDELEAWEEEVRLHTYVHTNVTQFLDGFRHDAHPMGMLLGAVAALSTFYPDAKEIGDEASRRLQRVRLIAKFPTIAAWVFRHSRGLPYVFPRNDLDYIGNFVNMTFEIGGVHEPNPVLQRALEILLVLHADHEQNASTNAVRGVGSTQVDPFSAVSAGVAALYGPLHGGANEQVLRMLDEIGDVKNVPAFIEGVKNHERLLMGFGHRVYKNYDPRAKLMRETCHEVLDALGLHDDPIFKLAMALEKIALEDEYFVARKLYPNVDFYSGIVQRAIGIPVSLFTAIFALARTVGWIAQLNEMIGDPEYKIGRPRQLYTGAAPRKVKAIAERT